MRSRRMVSIGVGALAVLAAACSDDDRGLPVAVAPEDFTVAVGEAPTFDACASTGEIVNYAWTIRETPSNMVDDVNKPLREQEEGCEFTLESNMVVDEIGTWVIELEVSDADGTTSTDTVRVEVTE